MWGSPSLPPALPPTTTTPVYPWALGWVGVVVRGRGRGGGGWGQTKYKPKLTNIDLGEGGGGGAVAVTSLHCSQEIGPI